MDIWGALRRLVGGAPKPPKPPRGPPIEPAPQRPRPATPAGPVVTAPPRPSPPSPAPPRPVAAAPVTPPPEPPPPAPTPVPAVAIETAPSASPDTDASPVLAPSDGLASRLPPPIVAPGDVISDPEPPAPPARSQPVPEPPLAPPVAAAPEPVPEPAPPPAPPIALEPPASPPTIEPAPTPAPQLSSPIEPAPSQPAPAQRLVRTILELGWVDADVPANAWKAFLKLATDLTGFDPTRLQPARNKPNEDEIDPEPKRLPPQPAGAMTIADVQHSLKQIGIFPGGRVDGILGYRTRSAIRLFQEYVRSVEGKADFKPDGRFGPKTQAELERWLASGRQVDWPRPIGESDKWLTLLEGVRRDRLRSPNAITRAVNEFVGRTTTRKTPDWDLSGPDRIHLIGIRRQEFDRKFDDIFVLILKGMVFKFQGTTEPGRSSNNRGAPYIVEGQHAFRFSWHQQQQLALRPVGFGQGIGPLVIRAGADGRLDPQDLANGLEPESTINIHWGSGRPLAQDIGGWSEGCQVIHGRFYITPDNKLQDCQSFLAASDSEVSATAGKTRGAYSVIVDLVTALSGDLPSNRVLYTLINEKDLDLDPELKANLKSARDRVMDKLGLVA